MIDILSFALGFVTAVIIKLVIRGSRGSQSFARNMEGKK